MLLYMHAERMARGEESYQGKLLEARHNDYKDEFVLGDNFGAHNCARVGSFFRRSAQMMQKVELFFHHFGSTCQYGSQHSGLPW